eukprot:jgi/Chrpa1/19711/Chrysochromulina_OHIO_Genome00024468-RA
MIVVDSQLTGKALLNSGRVELKFSQLLSNLFLNLRCAISSMDTSAVAALANVLASPACRLVTLGLNGNGLSVRSVVHLARSLANNTRLRKIELNHNHVGIAGAQALIASAISGGALLAVSLVNAGVGVKWYSLLHHQLKINLAHVPRVAGAAGGSEL